MSREVAKAEARVRGSLYGLLALAFYPPTKESGHIQDEMARVIRVLGLKGGEFTNTSSPDPSHLEQEYNRLFVGPGHVVCPPYESVHVGGAGGSAPGSVLGPPAHQVGALYADAGLKVAEGFTDLPDHVSVELEFMKYLCDQEASAPDSEHTKWSSMQAKFTSEHIGRWGPAFADSVAKNTTSVFYSEAATLLKEFLLQEKDNLPSGRHTQRHS